METEPFLHLIDKVLYIKVYPLTYGTIFGIILLGLLLFMSALISGSEVALFSLNPNDTESLRRSHQKSSKNVIHLLSSPNRLLATILISNNFINVGIVILSSFLSNSLFDFSVSPTLGFVFQVIVITLMLLLFGEIIPKIYATNNSVYFSKLMSGILLLLQSIFKPLSSLLIYSTSRFHRFMAKKKQNISMDDLSDMLEMTSAVITEDKKILEGIVKFSNIFVKEIMKSRMDVFAIDIKTKFIELIPQIVDSGFSRVPVFSESFDNIRGILYVKDLLPYIDKPEAFKWQSLIRPAYFVPETKRINDLLKEFQTNKIHLAIVIDEYGGSQGIITMEDILEEIVGEIVDESDEEDILFTQVDENTYIFEGKTSLNDFFKLVNIPDNTFDEIKGDAETLAGLILEVKGEIPEVGHKLSYKYFTFQIKEVDKKRIKKIEITINRRIDAN